MDDILPANFVIDKEGTPLTLTPIGRQEGLNCSIEAGAVEGDEYDDLYVSFSRENEQPDIILMTKDEMLALMWVCTGTLWSKEMGEKDG